MTEAMYLVNGREHHAIDAADRGLQYGDGLFETIAVRDGGPRRWDRHMRRLAEGCRRLGIPAPDPLQLLDEARRLCTGRDRAVLKVIVTRGPGGHGYRPPGRVRPTRILSCRPWPDYPERYTREGVRVRLCSTRLGLNPALAGLKHLNRLEQVLAAAECEDPGIQEGLMLDAAGRLIEGTRTNLFLVRDGTLLTPDLSRCGVAGILRDVILELAERLDIAVRVTDLTPETLYEAQEVFLCNALIGIWPVRGLEERTWPVGPVTRRLMEHLPETN